MENDWHEKIQNYFLRQDQKNEIRRLQEPKDSMSDHVHFFNTFVSSFFHVHLYEFKNIDPHVNLQTLYAQRYVHLLHKNPAPQAPTQNGSEKTSCIAILTLSQKSLIAEYLDRFDVRSFRISSKSLNLAGSHAILSQLKKLSK